MSGIQCNMIQSKISFTTSIIVLVLLVVTGAAKEKVIYPMDPNIVTFPSENSPEDKVSQVKTMVKLNDNTIVIGAVNLVAKFSADLKTLIKRVQLEPSAEDISQCGDDLEKCRNYILSLVIGKDDSVYACGTYARQPRCWTFDQDLNEISVNKYKFLPRLSNKNLTVMYTGVGSSYLFAYDNIYKGKTVKTAEENMNKVNFVSSLEYDDYTYFFLREVAAGGDDRKHIYSRVARLCKYEDASMLYDQFNTFLKAQLICKKEGTLVPVYYDEIQATTEVLIGDEVYIYAVFSTSSEIGSDSALCRYKMKDVSDSFYYSKMSDHTGNTKKGVEMSAERSSISRSSCNENFTQVHTNSDKTIDEVAQNALLFNHVQPKMDNNEAIFTLSTRFSSISSDQIRDSETGEITTVLFIASVDGQVYKIIIEKDKPRLVERIRPFKTQGPIYKVDVYNNMVYVGGPKGVAAFGAQRCTSNVLCTDCLINKDPYCAWVGTSCVLASSSDAKNDITDASLCPKVPADFKCSVTTVQRGVLECNIIKPSNNGPVPSILNWKYGGSDILGRGGQDYRVTSDKWHSTLIISNLTMDSRGNYKCVIGNQDHKTYCDFELKEQDIRTATPTSPVSKPSSEITTSSPRSSSETTTPVQSTARPSHNGTGLTTDEETIIKPTGAPVSQDDKSNYFMAFIGTLILLLIILLILLAVVLYKRHQHRAARAHVNESPKKTKVTNGVLSPKKQKYDISNKNNKRPEVCIEMKEESKLLPKDDASPVLVNGGDNKNDEKSGPTNNDEKDSLLVNT